MMFHNFFVSLPEGKPLSDKAMSISIIGFASWSYSWGIPAEPQLQDLGHFSKTMAGSQSNDQFRVQVDLRVP